MIRIDIPGRRCLEIREVVFDYNGTIAIDGIMPENIKNCIQELTKHVSVRILTADTYGTVIEQVKELDVRTCTFPREGACACLLSEADICVRSMEDACRLLLNPDRIRATLRTFCRSFSGMLPGFSTKSVGKENTVKGSTATA